MIMHKGLDTGPMLNMEKTAIADDETTGQLHDGSASFQHLCWLIRLTTMMT